MNTIEKAQNARRNDHLNELIRHEGKIMTRRNFINSLVTNGWKLATRQELKIKDPRAQTWNQMTRYEQDEFVEKQRKAGMKTVYFMELVQDNTLIKISKTEYDFAKSILSTLSTTNETMPTTTTRDDISQTNDPMSHVPHYCILEPELDEDQEPVECNIRECMCKDTCDIAIEYYEKLGKLQATTA